MKLIIPAGMAPAAELNREARQWLCRPCVDRRERIVLIADAAHLCADCGETITGLTDGETPRVPAVQGVSA